METVVSPKPLVQLARDFDRKFLRACDLKLFTLVEGGINSTDKVSRHLKISYRSARHLLDGMTSLGLLIREGEHYQTTPLSSTYLVEGKITYLGDMFAIINQNYSQWMTYERERRQGHLETPLDEHGTRYGTQSDEETIFFTRTMHAFSLGPGMLFGQKFDFTGRKYLLDLAGGSGALSIGAVTHNPWLRATILERPTVCSIARTYIEAAGMTDRINVMAADLFSDDYPSGPDIHMYSSIFCELPADRCLYLLRKSYNSLTSGGLVIIHDWVTEASHVGPNGQLPSDTDTATASPYDAGHTFIDYVSWLEYTGFSDIKLYQLTSTNWLVYGYKPS